MTLRTLNDINFFDEHNNQIAKEYNDSVKKELKAEAIKWVKELSNVETEKDSLNWYLNSPLIEWIKHFFNITSEDLK